MFKLLLHVNFPMRMNKVNLVSCMSKLFNTEINCFFPQNYPHRREAPCLQHMWQSFKIQEKFGSSYESPHRGEAPHM